MIAAGLEFLAARMGVELGPWPDAPITLADPRPALPRFDVAAATQIYLPDRTLSLWIRRSPRPTTLVVLHVTGPGGHREQTYDAQASRLAAALPGHVVQLEPAKGDGGRFHGTGRPAPLTHDDVMAAIRWCAHGVREFRAERIVLAGDGPAANLVLAAAAASRDEGIDIAAAVVNHPVVGESASQDGAFGPRPGGASLSVRLRDPAVLPPLVVGVGGLDPALEAVLADVYRWREVGVDARLRIFPSLGSDYVAALEDSVAAERACVTICRDAAEALDAPVATPAAT